MKDRALRRHQDFKAKRKSQKAYVHCLGDDLPGSEYGDGSNVEKLKKACVMSHFDKHHQKEKPLRERKHDISMREQLT